MAGIRTAIDVECRVRTRYVGCGMAAPHTFAATPRVQSRIRLPERPEGPAAKTTGFERATVTGDGPGIAVRGKPPDW